MILVIYFVCNIYRDMKNEQTTQTKKERELSEQTENQYDEDGEVVLDKETLELYELLENKSRMVSTNMVFFLDEMDRMNPVIRKNVAKEINDDLDDLLRKLETPASRRRKMM